MKATILLFAVMVILAGMLLCAGAPRPAAAVNPTLDAAILVIIQATRDEQDRRNAAAATRSATEAEAARQNAIVQATAAAVSVQQTQEAAQATRSYQSTVAALEMQSTRAALDAQATAERQRNDATATRAAIVLDATRNAATATAAMGQFEAESTRQAIQRRAEYEGRLESLRVGGVILALVIGVGLAGLAAHRLWRIAPPISRQPIAKSHTEPKGPPPAPDEIPPAPPTRVVVDAEAAQRIGELLEMQ